jgi:hypothetical protein
LKGIRGMVHICYIYIMNLRYIHVHFSSSIRAVISGTETEDTVRTPETEIDLEIL